MGTVVGFRFGHELHVRKDWEFRRTYRLGGRAKGDFVSVVVCRNRLPHSRLGLSVSKKVGGSVRRNKIKRMLREAYRLTRWEIESRAGHVDVVLIPRQEIEKFPLAALMQELPPLIERASARMRVPRRGGRNNRSRPNARRSR